MDTTHLSTLVALAERARRAGLIDWAEMPAALAAVNAAKDAIKQTTEPEADQPGEGQKAKKSG